MFIYYILIALALTRIPVMGVYFRLFNTLIHEIGHVLGALFTRGSVNHINLHPDTSGEASTGSRGRISSIIVTLSGYPFASGVALLLIFAIHQQEYINILYGTIGLVVISLIFWIRNLFGIMWLLIAGGITLGFILYEDPELIKIYATIIVAVIFVESVMSTLELFKIMINDRKESGDAHNLRNHTGITEYFWGLLFIAVACIPIYYSFDLWF